MRTGILCATCMALGIAIGTVPGQHIVSYIMLTFCAWLCGLFTQGNS